MCFGGRGCEHNALPNSRSMRPTVRCTARTNKRYIRQTTPDCNNRVSTNANLGWARPGAPSNTERNGRSRSFVRVVPMGVATAEINCPLNTCALPLSRHVTHKRTLGESTSLVQLAEWSNAASEQRWSTGFGCVGPGADFVESSAVWSSSGNRLRFIWWRFGSRPLAMLGALALGSRSLVLSACSSLSFPCLLD